jgi:hypothetical protein
VMVHLVRRDDDAGACFFDLMPQSWVKGDKETA